MMNPAALIKSIKESSAAQSPWRERIVLCFAVAASYASVWPNEFVFDDKFLIIYNVLLRHWSTLPDLLTSNNMAGSGEASGFYRPVPMLLHFFIYQAFGASTVAFHALNVALQALNACLLYHFGSRAGFKKGAAFAAALLWAVHPLHTEAVAYMSSTPELLWATFCLLGLIVLLPDFSPRRMWLTAAFFMLALGSKEVAVVFPALVVISFFLTSKNRTRLTAYFRTWPLWLLAIGYTIAWMLFIHKTGYTLVKSTSPEFFQEYTSNIINRILTCLATLPTYARLILWPTGLHMERNFPVYIALFNWRSMLGALMVALGLLQTLLGHTRHGVALSFGLLWFAAALLPATGIILPVNAMISEHWLYLPMMGLFLGATQTASGLFKKEPAASQLIVFALALSLGCTTFIQNKTWRNHETFYQNIVQNNGNLVRISAYLGVYYLDKREFDKAAERFRYEIDHPDSRPQARWAGTHMRLAIALLGVHADRNANVTVDDVTHALSASTHIPEAIAELGKALQADPNYYWAHQYLSAIYRYEGNDVMAAFHDRKAVEIWQKYGPPVKFNFFCEGPCI